MIRVAVLDDYQHAAPDFGDWDRLAARATIDFFDRNIAGIEEAAEALAPFDVLCLMRERMAMPRQLIERLPNLKLIVVTGPRTRSLDKQAARERGIAVAHTRSSDSPAAPVELAFGLILALMRHIPQEHDNMPRTMAGDGRPRAARQAARPPRPRSTRYRHGADRARLRHGDRRLESASDFGPRGHCGR